MRHAPEPVFTDLTVTYASADWLLGAAIIYPSADVNKSNKRCFPLFCGFFSVWVTLCRISRPDSGEILLAGALRNRSQNPPPRAASIAAPSRMSCSETTIASSPNAAMVSTRMIPPATIVGARSG